MNKILFVLSTWVLMVLVGCDNNLEMTSCESNEEADAVAFEYLVLQNGTYVLNMSEEMAKKRGLSPIDYQRIKKEVAETNSLLQEVAPIEDSSIALINPQNFDLNFSKMRILTRSESTPNGNGILSDENYITISIHVPRDCTYIEMHMYSNSMIGACTATLYYGGKPYSTGTCISSSVTGDGCINLKVPMGGETYNVSFRVSSSFGGSYYYYYR